MLKKMLIVTLLMWPSIIFFQSGALAKNQKPQQINSPEMILFSDSKQSVTYKVDEKDQAVAALFATTDQSKPIFIYIHGRALGVGNGYDQEPEESMKCCISELFTRYGANRVLMFHWPHWGKGIDYNGPAQDAKSAGKALAELLVEVERVAKSRNTGTHGPLILISHSMGSIVLEEALARSPSLELKDFHTIGIFSPASRYGENQEWLSRIKSTNRYVFSNVHDPILRFVNDALGKCGAECLISKEHAQGMVYIDVSPTDPGHRYFSFDNLDGAKGFLAKNIIWPILKGEKPKFQGEQPYSNQNIYIIHAQ